MFSTGRLIFTLVFILVFIGVMIWAYRKDMKDIRKWFPRPGIVFLIVLVVIFVYYVLSKIV